MRMTLNKIIKERVNLCRFTQSAAIQFLILILIELCYRIKILIIILLQIFYYNPEGKELEYKALIVFHFTDDFQAWLCETPIIKGPPEAEAEAEQRLVGTFLNSL